jgi:ribosomal protein L31E
MLAKTLYTTKEFHISSYRFQYWLYPILNKAFGKEVRFNRDSLHSVSAVNRHGFEISSNTQSLSKIKDFFIKKLKESNFTVDKEFNQEIVNNNFIKITKRLTGEEMLFVGISEQKTGLDFNNRNYPVLIVNVFTKWSKNRK